MSLRSTQALVVLDQRYRNTPGWEPLAQSARLGWAALATALDVNLGQPDYASTTSAGARDQADRLVPPGRGSLACCRPQHNLVVRMKSVPNATNLRLVIDSQRLLSATWRRTRRGSTRGSPNAGPSAPRPTPSSNATSARIGGLLGKGG